jgi:hypothetical protein
MIEMNFIPLFENFFRDGLLEEEYSTWDIILYFSENSNDHGIMKQVSETLKGDPLRLFKRFFKLLFK